MSDKKYDVILADPPWKQSKGGKKDVRKNSSGGSLDYQTMDLSLISKVLSDFSKKGANNHSFFLWTIDKFLFESENIMKKLGYKLHARMVWNKVTGIPAAFTIRFGHEYLLWFYKEKLIPIDKKMRGKVHSVFTEKVTKHSKKPIISYQIIEALYPESDKLELFARDKRVGWDVWGNEVEPDIDYIVYEEVTNGTL